MREATKIEVNRARHDQHRALLEAWLQEHFQTVLTRVLPVCTSARERAAADPVQVLIFNLAAFALDDLTLSMVERERPADAPPGVDGVAAGDDGRRAVPGTESEKE